MTQAPSSNPRRRHASTVMTLGLSALHVIPLLLGWYCGWPWAVAGVLAVGLALAAGSLCPHSRLFGTAIRRIPGTRREVILTIDDGPCADTVELLETLAAHRVRAVFFLIGERALQRPQDVRRILAAGHLIGNHTHTHPAYWFWSFPAWRQRRELAQCQQALVSISGVVPRLFRAPAGMKNPYCQLVAAELDLQVVGWQARGLDGIPRPLEKILGAIRRALCPGAIVLVHQGMPHSPEVLRRVLLMLEDDGWTTTLPAAWVDGAHFPV